MKRAILVGGSTDAWPDVSAAGLLTDETGRANGIKDMDGFLGMAVVRYPAPHMVVLMELCGVA